MTAPRYKRWFLDLDTRRYSHLLNLDDLKAIAELPYFKERRPGVHEMIYIHGDHDTGEAETDAWKYWFCVSNY